MKRDEIYQAALSAVIAVVLLSAILVVLAFFAGCAGTGVGVRVQSEYGALSYDLPERRK